MKRLLTSAWLLGLLVAIPVLVILPPVFQKFRTSFVEKVPIAGNILHTYFYDLDGNGTLEKIQSVLNDNQLSFHIYTSERKLKDQMNFSHDFYPKTFQLYFGDSDEDGYAEVYAFTMSNDTLFLNWFEPFPDFTGQQHTVFITCIGTYAQGKFDFGITSFNIIDFDKDGKNEIVFSVEAGFSLSPRRIFIYTPHSVTLKSTEDNGINSYHLKFADLNLDGKTEIVTSSSSSGNLVRRYMKDTIDNRPWLQVFDDSLKYLFAPLPFPEGMVNEIKTFVTGRENNSLVVFHFFQGSADNIPVKIYKVTLQGYFSDSLLLPNDESPLYLNVLQLSCDTFLLAINNKIFEINAGLRVTGTKKTKHTFLIHNRVNLTGISSGEYILNTPGNSLFYIYDRHFIHRGTIELQEPARSMVTETNLGPGYLMVLSGHNELYYRYHKNCLFWLKYPFYFLIYLISAGFIRLIQWITEKGMQERYELQSRVRELQFKSFSSQMDPHFMLNLFTIMASLMQKGEREDAFRAFLKFSKLVRDNFENSDQLIRTLGEELEIVRNWLDLGMLRYGEKLSYEIHLEEDVDQNTPVPKMSLQIHVENAVKHGLLPRQGQGRILIQISRSADYLKMLVEDDGIGREKAKENNPLSTKKGLQMLKSVYDRLNDTNRIKIIQKITDLVNDRGESAGTLVEIDIPLKLKEPEYTA